MSRTSSRRLTVLALIVFLGLSLPVSAATSAERHPGVMDRLASWVDSLWSLLVPTPPTPPTPPNTPGRDARLIPALDANSTDRGALIDPNGGH